MPRTSDRLPYSEGPAPSHTSRAAGHTEVLIEVDADNTAHLVFDRDVAAVADYRQRIAEVVAQWAGQWPIGGAEAAPPAPAAAVPGRRRSRRAPGRR